MAGIYIHIPFCKQKCAYCDFHFSTTYASYRDRMIDAIVTDLRQRVDYLKDRPVETIYFGGGTPSLLSEQEINRILDTVRQLCELNTEVEITLEANPDDITTTSLQGWKSAGINRLSIGLQSFKSEDLQWMNRAHTMEESSNCVALAQAAGFDNITVDLIYGLPDLSMIEWEQHVRRVIDMNVQHISAYCLTVESNTALNNWVRMGKIKVSSEDEQSDQFLRLLEMMKENDFIQYEISNYCKPGGASKHNSNYWKGEWYLGVGPSAHSYNGLERNWNISNNQRYMQLVEQSEQVCETEVLTEVDKFNEAILTGLRTIYGVNLSQLPEKFVNDSNFIKSASEFIEKEWIRRTEDKIVLTTEGKLRADFIASELFITPT